MPPPRSLLELRPADLAVELNEIGEPAYRARQVFRWIFEAGATSFEAMTDLPVELRALLARRYSLTSGREVARSESPDGTLKILLAWPDGATTECVMIPARETARRTACLSTQVGCDVGCRFCASGVGGAMRNLGVGEILEQAVVLSRALADRGERLSHVVFMGMGEPLANYRATVEAVKRLNAEWSLHVAQRRMTISTVGLSKQIDRLAGEGLQVTLALSLHAADPDLRERLIPWAARLKLEEILAACKRYFLRTGREVTLEYCLLAGVNDRTQDVENLARVARELRANVNLLMYNPVPGLPYRRPAKAGAVGFLRALRAIGVNAHLRESRGLEVDAACGQLRRRHRQEHQAAPS
jgi:23S rRNA (adenine2503-C2)-methyltransferase